MNLNIFGIFTIMEVPNNAISITAYWTWMGSDGIVRTKVKPGFDVTLTHAMENSSTVNALPSEKKFPILIDARDIRSITREAREYFSVRGRETKINSMAVLIKSPVSRVVGNFFIAVSNPAVPTKLFDAEHEALGWLKTFV